VLVVPQVDHPAAGHRGEEVRGPAVVALPLHLDGTDVVPDVSRGQPFLDPSYRTGIADDVAEKASPPARVFGAQRKRCPSVSTPAGRDAPAQGPGPRPARTPPSPPAPGPAPRRAPASRQRSPGSGRVRQGQRLPELAVRRLGGPPCLLEGSSPLGKGLEHAAEREEVHFVQERKRPMGTSARRKGRLGLDAAGEASPRSSGAAVEPGGAGGPVSLHRARFAGSPTERTPEEKAPARGWHPPRAKAGPDRRKRSPSCRPIPPAPLAMPAMRRGVVDRRIELLALRAGRARSQELIATRRFHRRRFRGFVPGNPTPSRVFDAPALSWR
jgi:hypothetical protein